MPQPGEGYHHVIVAVAVASDQDRILAAMPGSHESPYGLNLPGAPGDGIARKQAGSRLPFGILVEPDTIDVVGRNIEPVLGIAGSPLDDIFLGSRTDIDIYPVFLQGIDEADHLGDEAESGIYGGRKSAGTAFSAGLEGRSLQGLGHPVINGFRSDFRKQR